MAPEKTKTYGRFSGAIFLEGFDPRKFLARNGLQGQKFPETEKTQEKMSFFPRAPRVFLPKRIIFGSFLTVKLLSVLQVVDHERVARL